MYREQSCEECRTDDIDVRILVMIRGNSLKTGTAQGIHEGITVLRRGKYKEGLSGYSPETGIIHISGRSVFH